MAAREAAYLLGLLLCLAAVALVRTAYIQDLAPAPNQTYVVGWSQEVYSSDRVLPNKGQDQDWLQALAADPDSALGNIYAKVEAMPEQLHDLGGLGWLVAGWSLAGVSDDTLFLAGIVGQTLLIFLIALLPRWSRAGADPKEAAELLWVGAIAAVLAIFSGTISALMALPVEALSLATLVFALTMTGRYVGRLSRDPETSPGFLSGLGVALAQCLAIYTDQTNLIILPIVTILSLLAKLGLGRRRLFALIWYVIFFLIVLAPAMLAAWYFDVAPPTEHVDQTLLGLRGSFDQLIATDAQTLLAGLERWAQAYVPVLSAPGLAIGIIGLIMLASGYGIGVPLVALVVHLVAAPISSATAEGTGFPALVVLPLLTIGIANFVVTGFGALISGWGRAFGTTTIGLLAALASLTVVAYYAEAQWPAVIEPIRAPIMAGEPAEAEESPAPAAAEPAAIMPAEPDAGEMGEPESPAPTTEPADPAPMEEPMMPMDGQPSQAIDSGMMEPDAPETSPTESMPSQQ